MKSSASLVVATVVLTFARDIFGHITLGMQKHVVDSPRNRLDRRQIVEGGYKQKGLSWLVDFDLGTPPTHILSQLDTGSTVLIVETDRSDVCTSTPAVCSSNGAYDANSSSTYQYVNSDMVVRYGGGDGCTGDFAKDTLTLGGVATPFEFGIMYKSTVLESVFGMSFLDGSSEPASYPYILTQAGKIASPAYSIWLNDLRAAGGEVTFGAVDTGKYTGTLNTFDVVPEEDNSYRELRITLNGIYFTQPDGRQIILDGSTINGPALIDSGTTFMLLPAILAASIVSALGGSSSDGAHFAPCSKVNSAGSLDFTFGTFTVHAPYFNFILSPQDDTQELCQVGISDSDHLILGDTFLTSAYAVFDLANKQISLAQSKLNADSSCIVAIGTGKDSVPHRIGGSPCVALPGTSTTTSTTTTSSSSSTKTTLSTTLTTATSTCNNGCAALLTAHPVLATAFCKFFTKFPAQATPAIAPELCPQGGWEGPCHRNLHSLSAACTCLASPTKH